MEDEARRICSFSMGQLIGFNFQKDSPLKDPKALLEMCFRATFVTSLLIDGVGFPRDYKVTAIDVINGQKLGWALGSMLYEINTLPWEFTDHSMKKAERLAEGPQSNFLLGEMSNRLGDSGGFQFAAGLVVVAVACIGLMSTFKNRFWSRRRSLGSQRVASSVHNAASEALASRDESRRNADYGTRGGSSL